MVIYKKIGAIILMSGCILVAGCSKEPAVTDDMLDGEIIFDPSIRSPEKYLVSFADSTPTDAAKNIPVVIACHGFSASTFEWDEFRLWAGTRTDFRISQVLLGGHGRTYAQFKDATWHDWQEAILLEYERLRKQGYKRISFAGSSASGALLINLLQSRYFEGKAVPKNIFLIDPFLIPGDKNLSLVKLMGPLLGYTEVVNTLQEDKVYYHFRPQESVQQLQLLALDVRKGLQKGISLPEGCSLKIYKSTHDETADPVSAVLMYKGLSKSDGTPIEVEMVESNLHVFTRLALRSQVSATDVSNQLKCFTEIADKLVK